MNSFPVPTYFSITWHTNTISTSCLQKILDRLPWKLRGELRKEIPPKQGQVPLTAKHNQKCQWCTMRVILSYFKPSQFLHSQTACYELRRKDKLRLVSCPVWITTPWGYLALLRTQNQNQWRQKHLEQFSLLKNFKKYTLQTEGREAQSIPCTCTWYKMQLVILSKHWDKNLMLCFC